MNSLKIWAKKERLFEVEGMIDTIRKALNSVEDQLRLKYSDVKLQARENSLQNQLVKWLSISESSARQKSRQNWLSLGDQSTKFFHTYAKLRVSRNHIHQLIDPSGEPLTTMEKIQQRAIDFYSDLFSNKGNW